MPLASRQLIPQTRPLISWIKPSSTLHLDFIGNQAAVNGILRPMQDVIECKRACNARALDHAGHVHGFKPNQPRITDRGLLVHESRTNRWPSDWQTLVEYDSAGIKVEKVGSGEVNGLNYIDIHIHGTNTSGSTQSPTIRLGILDTFSIPAVIGKKVSMSLWMSVLDATAPGSQPIQCRMNEFSGSTIESGYGYFLDTPLTASLDRKSFRHTVITGDNIRDPHLTQTVPAGETLNYVLRIAAPQIEIGAHPSPPVPPQDTVTTDIITLREEALAQVGSEGTWLIDFDLPEEFEDQRIWFLTHGGGRRFLYKNGGTGRPGAYDGSKITSFRDLNTGINRLAITFDGSGTRAADSSGGISSGTTNLTSSPEAALQIGGHSSYHTPNAPIRSLIYLPKALSNIQLQNLVR